VLHMGMRSPGANLQSTGPPPQLLRRASLGHASDEHLFHAAPLARIIPSENTAKATSTCARRKDRFQKNGSNEPVAHEWCEEPTIDCCDVDRLD
jgi:hypothetical protein